MIARKRSKAFSSISSSLICLPIPGISLNVSLSEPIRSICSNWSSKSFKSNLFFESFFSSSAAFFSSSASSAFSINESTSPIPRIREAIRLGWNASRLSSFSPVPTNLIGLPVTALTESAAPPRVSPSSFVRITPSIPKVSLKLLATLTAS